MWKFIVHALRLGKTVGTTGSQLLNRFGRDHNQNGRTFRIRTITTDRAQHFHIGDNNLMIEQGVRIDGLSLTVRGVGNTLTLAARARVHGLDLVIDGDQNRIHVGAGATINGMSVVMGGNLFSGNFRGNRNHIEFGPQSGLSSTRFEVTGSDNAVSLGDRVHVVKRGEVYVTGHGCVIRIGADTSIQSASLATGEIETAITVGTDNMWSDDIVVLASDGHPIARCGTLDRSNLARDVAIGDHVWLGRQAALLKGTRIGDGCIVGARAVVCGAVADDEGALFRNATIVGAPARPVKLDQEWFRDMIVTEQGYELKYPDACAESYFRRALWWLAKGREQLAVGHPSEATEALSESAAACRRAVTLKPDYVFAYTVWAKVLEAIGLPEESREKVAIAAALSKGST